MDSLLYGVGCILSSSHIRGATSQHWSHEARRNGIHFYLCYRIDAVFSSFGFLNAIHEIAFHFEHVLQSGFERSAAMQAFAEAGLSVEFVEESQPPLGYLGLDVEFNGVPPDLHSATFPCSTVIRARKALCASKMSHVRRRLKNE